MKKKSDNIELGKIRTSEINAIIDDWSDTGIPPTYSDEKKSTINSDISGSEESEMYIDDFDTNSDTFNISLIELGIFNRFFHSVYMKKTTLDNFKIDSFGDVDSVGLITYGGSFDVTDGWFFNSILDDIELVFQTRVFFDRSQQLITQLNISTKKKLQSKAFNDLYNKIKKISFNNSEYVGKCIKVKVNEGVFKKIEVIDMPKTDKKLILNPIQEKYITHFISRVGRGSAARYLLNGTPGTGKTESIRDIIKALTPEVTFIIPDFSTTDDLTTILESCEVFDKSVIIMDDIDLYLGSRDNGSYTRLLGEFLSFFDGVKKRKISLLASTNDKGLVDKAAERPGRFNMTIDFTYLTEEQIIQVCNQYLPLKYQVDEVYGALKSNIGSNKAKITGAFIFNLAENIKEMASDDLNWSINDTVNLIKESYNGFYNSQVRIEKNAIKYEIER